jgi:hypothetical protein
MTEDTPNKPTHKFNTPEPDAFLGMTRRDWFAGMAMPEYINNNDYSMSDESVVQSAYRMADLMIKVSKRGR